MSESKTKGLMQHAETAAVYHYAAPVRVEADTSEMVDMAMTMASRAANPSSRPPEAAPMPHARAQTLQPNRQYHY